MQVMKPNHLFKPIAITASFLVAILAQPVRASIAYGSINNFDTVNDTGHECHGFEIEIEDCRSIDISYTYDYNHYGTSKITQDDSIPGHPKCLIRWASKKNPDGTWASYTAMPSGPVNPTDGHQFTNPSVNFGGEHFGVGYGTAVGAIRYNWLVDDGGGNLVSGGTVQVSTPVYTYYPPFNGAPAQVQAVIAPPVPEVPDPMEFGNAVWVKEIRTTSHNNQEVKLRDLVSDDPADPDDKNWKNGEADEVETEWQILQKDSGKADGGVNNEVPAAAEDLPNEDEVVTRRYEFYKYVGPIDAESGEAMADAVGPDGVHGVGIKIINGADVDLSTVEIVGEFTGSQMAAVDVDAPVGLIDHISEGSENEPFTERRLVVQGALPFNCMQDGALPTGMEFDVVSGVLSGTPTQSGEFMFTVTAFDGINPDVSKNYTLLVAAAGAVIPPTSILDTVASPLAAGTTTGDGAYDPGAEVTVTASPLPGFRFLNWTDNGTIVSTVNTHTFTIDVNHSLIANFTSDLPQWTVSTSEAPANGGVTSGDGLMNDGSATTVVAEPNAGYVFTNWTLGGNQVSTAPSYTFTITADTSLIANFMIVGEPRTITASANPISWGTITGAGTYAIGDTATLVAVPNPGYAFSKWNENNTNVSTSPNYTFTVTGNRTLSATFIKVFIIEAGVSPLIGGTTEMDSTSYKTDENAKAQATAADGFTFANWTENGVVVSTDENYVFNVTRNRILVANFIADSGITINADCEPSLGGSVSGDDAYLYGDDVLISAIPNDGYTFLNWTMGSVVVSTDPAFVFNAIANTALVAHFAPSIAIAASAFPLAGGTVNGAGDYAGGANATLTAIANPGYAFTGWTDGAAAIDAPAAYTFSVAGVRTLVANFIQLPPMTFVAGAAGSNTLTLSWSTANVGWILEESSDLSTWTPSTRPVNAAGDQKTITVPITGSGHFFRLSHP